MMSSLITNLKFELGVRFRGWSTFVYYILFLTIGVLIGLIGAGAFKGASVSFGLSNKVLANSPMSINMVTSLMGAFGLFIIAPIFGQSIYRDFGSNVSEIIYSSPTHRRGHLLGRFLAAVIVCLFIFSSIALGMWISSLLPMAQQSMLGENKFINYVMPYLTGQIPNLFIFGSIFFVMAAKLKKMAPVYISGVLIFMGWMLAGQLSADLDNKMIVSLIDPFGINAVSELTRYWSVEDQNTRLVMLEGYYLYNRLLWGLVGLFCLGISLFTFNEQKPSGSKNKKAAKSEATPVSIPAGMVTAIPSFDSSAQWLMFRKKLGFELKQIFSSIYFQSILLAGVIYVFIVSTQLGKIYGTETYPVTYQVLSILGGVFDLFILIILTFYGGEVVWRDRNQRIDQVVDAFPTPSWVSVISKYLSLLCVAFVLLSILGVCGVIVQTVKGYTQYEFALYAQTLYGIKFISLINLAALAFFVQVIAKNKFVGFAIIIGYYVLNIVLGMMDFSHGIYKFNSGSLAKYSDMNGYGRFLWGYYSYKFYWMMLSALLMTFSFLWWQRGVLSTFADKKKEFMRRLNSRFITAMSVFAVLFIASGSYIFYNTNILNTYYDAKDTEQAQFDYEKKYQSYKKANILDVVGVHATVDIFPYKTQMNSKVISRLENKSKGPVKKMLVNIPAEHDFKLSFDRAFKVIERNDRLSVAIYEFEQPVAVGEKVVMDFSIHVDNSSIRETGFETNIVKNGTFFNKWAYYPMIGYQDRREIAATKTRKKYGLEKKERMPKIDDHEAHEYSYLSNNSRWIDFEAIVSTAGDQTAVAPGTLIKKWSENGRNFFHYKMDQKILDFYAFLSAKYVVKKDKWNDVAIEVYHHPGHDKNVESMIESTKMSLDYFTKNFSPYQHKQFRIFEFPRYSTFAQAFPNTIPFSEGIGFIAKVDKEDPEDIDYPFYVTAHELAHQWWAHQVIGGGVQGVTMLSETFSQYSALMVMEKRYGKERMRKFLKYELSRYLSGRGHEHEGENPLYLNENQSYIHYRKGSLVMYALKDYIGEDLVNETMRDFIKMTAYQQGPFTNTKEFLSLLKSKLTKQEDHQLVEDLFEKIVLFDNRMMEASYTRLNNGQYSVKVKIKSAKVYSDEQGKETHANFSLPIYISAQDEKKNFLYLKKHMLKSGENEVEFMVKEKPHKAGVDPLNILVDKNPDDNTSKLKERSKA